MKNILIVSDGFLNGGFETRTQRELNEAKKHRYNVFLACMDYNYEHDLFKQVLILKRPLTSYADSAKVKDILATRDQIINFCKKNRVDLIECHPFWCSLPASLAAEKLNIPITYTLHGVTSGNFISPEPANIGLRTLYYVGLRYGFDKIFAVAEYLRNQYSYLSSDIAITRNGIDMPKKPRTPYSPRNGYFCIASRLDAPKTELVKNFLPALHSLPEVHDIDIFGDGDQLDSLKAFVDRNHFNKVSIKGWQRDLPKVFAGNHYAAIFGMGQVVLEAFNSNTPVGVLGYGGFAGFVKSDKNLCYFAKNNFTDWQNHNIDLKKELQKLKENPNDYLLSYQEISEFDQSNIWGSHFKAEESFTFLEKPILKSLNHLFDSNSSASLDIKKLLLEATLLGTKNDPVYQLFLENIENASKTIEVDRLKAEVDTLKKELDNITNSGFWKTTKPLRKILNKLH